MAADHDVNSAAFFIEERDFLKADALARHGFFGRNGGVSTGIYSSLNAGIGSDDQPDAVRQNRARIAAAIGVSAQNLLTLHQIHSADCVTVTEAWDFPERPRADAMVSNVQGLALGILTADCAPVLFYGEDQDGAPVIGAAHAGWGGALKGVLENTVEAMGALNVPVGHIRAVIGPCIGPESYEVSDDFSTAFLAQDAANSNFFTPARRSGHLMFDLPGYCAYRLALAGVPQVFVKGIDTCFNEEDYYSYRRATHRQEPDYGRQVSVITIL